MKTKMKLYSMWFLLAILFQWRFIRESRERWKIARRADEEIPTTNRSSAGVMQNTPSPPKIDDSADQVQIGVKTQSLSEGTGSVGASYLPPPRVRYKVGNYEVSFGFSSWKSYFKHYNASIGENI